MDGKLNTNRTQKMKVTELERSLAYEVWECRYVECRGLTAQQFSFADELYPVNALWCYMNG